MDGSYTFHRRTASPDTVEQGLLRYHRNIYDTHVAPRLEPGETAVEDISETLPYSTEDVRHALALATWEDRDPALDVDLDADTVMYEVS